NAPIIDGTSAGTLNKTGAGTLALGAANSYTGGTVISSGTLLVGTGGTAGDLSSGSVTVNAALAFNRSDNPVISNIISGAGTLNQIGSGTTQLSGSNPFSGITNITNGAILLGDPNALA